MDFIQTPQIPFTQPQTITFTEDEQYLGKVVTTDLNEIFKNRTIVFNAQCCPHQEMQAQAHNCISLLERIPCSKQVNGLLKKRLILELYTDLTSSSSCPKITCRNTLKAMLLDLQSIIASRNTPFIPYVLANAPSDAVKQATEGLVALVADCLLSTSFPEIQMHNALTRRDIIKLPDVTKENNSNFIFSDLIKFYDDVLNHSLNTLRNVNIPIKVMAVIIYRIATQLYEVIALHPFLNYFHLSTEVATALNTLKKRLLSLITSEWPPAPSEAKTNDPTVLAPVMHSSTYELLYPYNNYNQDTLQSSTLPSTRTNIDNTRSFC